MKENFFLRYFAILNIRSYSYISLRWNHFWIALFKNKLTKLEKLLWKVFTGTIFEAQFVYINVA